MSLTPTNTMMTNELKLHDFKGAKASLTYGDADINDGYSYLRVNFRANDEKFDFWQDKPRHNIIAEELTFNDKKIWHEDNDGPMSGLNADMLDGLHSSEFKDRNGHNHFGHAFLPGGSKAFIKIATFTPRRVGNAPDFSNTGAAPYQGIFAENIAKRMNARDKFNAFVEDTPERLGQIGFNGFEHTDMYSEGVYNSTLRASISLLRKGDTKSPTWRGPETVDIHVGIFEDPTNLDEDGWSCTSRYFYVSAHERNLPFIKLPDSPNHNYIVGGNVSPRGVKESDINTTPNVANNNSDNDGIMPAASVTKPGYEHSNSDHERPPVTGEGYKTPPSYGKAWYKAQRFPEVIDPGFSYQKNIESFRLYHVDSHSDMVDGVKVVTHKFDLYMVVDTKMEVHVQPYMSSSCLFYNYQKPLVEYELPQGKYMTPLSIYDNRYSHVEHRHRNYEQKMEDMDDEIEQIWKSFDDYVTIDQGSGNANKVLMTNARGQVVCEIDNLERHRDDRRKSKRVLVTSTDYCIAESDITTSELAQLKDIRANIQDQIDELKTTIPPAVDTGAYVLKRGDTMTGNLNMTESSKLVFSNTNSQFSLYGKGGTDVLQSKLTMYDNKEGKTIFEYSLDSSFGQKILKLAKNSMLFDNQRLTISSTQPPNPKVGDIWIKNQ